MFHDTDIDSKITFSVISTQLSHLARELANFRLIFSPSLKDAIRILRINFYRISL